jgi:asparagine synthetase B (glutamine-hydrolysing)
MLTPEGLSPLEAACGLVFGGDIERDPSRTPAYVPPPAQALTKVLASALSRPPCVVAFSGGRDSSLVLAAAVAAARRDQLPEPIPVTLRFPAAPDSEESQWQERMVAFLALREWVRIEMAGGLDMIGDVARRLLAEHGPLYPPNAHLLAPMLEHARGGTVVGGLGGDELFGLWARRRLADVAARRVRPEWRDAARVVGAVAPPGVRVMALRRRRLTNPVPWLRTEAQAALEAALVEQQAYAPLRWDRHALAAPRARSLVIATRDLGRITAAVDAEFRAPLIDPRFVASLAIAGGWRGFGGRTATLRALFSELLPDDVLGRRHKATFNGAFFTGDARRFAGGWSGRGLDEAVVDPDALRRAWSTPAGDYRSAMLLQSAWLHDRGAVQC